VIAGRPFRHLSVARLSDNSKSMNLRHAAALALVGWYLMFPPWVAPNTFDAHAPLSEWHQYEGGYERAVGKKRWKDDTGAFDSRAECVSDQKSIVELYRTNPKWHDAEWFVRVWSAAQCVPTNDPRLKSKSDTDD
jgi:hypothetical protein